MDKKAIWEAVKEPLRLLVLAVIPFAIAYLSEWTYEWAVVATVFLRFVDKLLHEVSKEKPQEERNDGYLGIKGLTGF